MQTHKPGPRLKANKSFHFCRAVCARHGRCCVESVNGNMSIPDVQRAYSRIICGAHMRARTFECHCGLDCTTSIIVYELKNVCALFCAGVTNWYTAPHKYSQAHANWGPVSQSFQLHHD